MNSYDYLKQYIFRGMTNVQWREEVFENQKRLIVL
jgi:hypothetical protein